MDPSYLLAPFLAWFAAGTLKFAINSAKAKRWAFDLIGYGGMPSTHSAIVSCTVAMIGLREGVAHPAFGVALTLAFVVLLDAASLRRQVGKHAEAINRLAADTSLALLRERMGHTKAEILGGVCVGCVVGSGIYLALS